MNIIFMRIIAVILSIVAFLQGGDISSAKMKVKSDVAEENPVITYTIENYTGKKIETTYAYNLYKQTADGNYWEKLEKKQSLNVSDAVVTIRNAEIFNDSIDLSNEYENIGTGHYKLEKSINFVGSDEYIQIIAEFNIGYIYE